MPNRIFLLRMALPFAMAGLRPANLVATRNGQS